jgi:hypothetical protein
MWDANALLISANDTSRLNQGQASKETTCRFIVLIADTKAEQTIFTQRNK